MGLKEVERCFGSDVVHCDETALIGNQELWQWRW